MKPRHRSIPCPGVPATLEAADIHEFCSVVASCKALYCLTTGTATLAAALRKPCTVLYGHGVNVEHHTSPMHRYVKL
jgi:hypothetical protein